MFLAGSGHYTRERQDPPPCALFSSCGCKKDGDKKPIELSNMSPHHRDTYSNPEFRDQAHLRRVAQNTGDLMQHVKFEIMLALLESETERTLTENDKFKRYSLPRRLGRKNKKMIKQELDILFDESWSPLEKQLIRSGINACTSFDIKKPDNVLTECADIIEELDKWFVAEKCKPKTMAQEKEETKEAVTFVNRQLQS